MVADAPTHAAPHWRSDPGVWFFSLEAASRIAVTIASTFWHLPYHHAEMTLEKGPDGIRYTSTRRSPPPLPAICDRSSTERKLGEKR